MCFAAARRIVSVTAQLSSGLLASASARQHCCGATRIFLDTDGVDCTKDGRFLVCGSKADAHDNFRIGSGTDLIARVVWRH